MTTNGRAHEKTIIARMIAKSMISACRGSYDQAMLLCEDEIVRHKKDPLLKERFELAKEHLQQFLVERIILEEE